MSSIDVGNFWNPYLSVSAIATLPKGGCAPGLATKKSEITRVLSIPTMSIGGQSVNMISAREEWRAQPQLRISCLTDCGHSVQPHGQLQTVVALPFFLRVRSAQLHPRKPLG